MGSADSGVPQTPPRRRRRRRRPVALVLALVSILAGAGMLVAVQRSQAPAVAPRAAAPSPPATESPAATPPSPLDDVPLEPPSQAPIAVVRDSPAVTVPILYYHFFRVDTNPKDSLGQRLSVTPGQFAAQMALLHAAGAHTITLADVMAALTQHRPLPPHPVVLTFDDGLVGEDTVALPVLERYGFVATCFVVPDFLNRPQYLSTAQLLDLSGHGMVIGAHTMDHVDLVAEPVAVARAQIDGSRAALQRLTGQQVLDFAYPYGALDAAVAALVQQDGFRDAVSTSYGVLQSLAARYSLERIEVVGGDTLASFAAKARVPLPRNLATPLPGAAPSPVPATPAGASPVLPAVAGRPGVVAARRPARRLSRR